MKRLLHAIPVILAAVASIAAAEPRRVEPVLSGQNGLLFVSIPIPGVLDAELRERAISGLANRILVSARIEAAGGGWHGAESVMTLQALYDVWDEQYLIRRTDMRGSTRRLLKEQTAYIDSLTRIDNIPIAGLATLDPLKKYIIRVTVSVNPPSKELVERAKEYLSDPEGAKRLSTPRTVFGSFAMTFIPSAINEAGKVYQFYTAPFSPAQIAPERPPGLEGPFR
ncbi:MAG: hypothetical protein WC889_20225 [Myxococcota bacterium]|jgi:hypothetical protein